MLLLVSRLIFLCVGSKPPCSSEIRMEFIVTLSLSGICNSFSFQAIYTHFFYDRAHLLSPLKSAVGFRWQIYGQQLVFDSDVVLMYCFPFSIRLLNTYFYLLSPFSLWINVTECEIDTTTNIISWPSTSLQTRLTVPLLIKFGHDFKFPHYLSPSPPVCFWASSEVIRLSVNYAGACITEADLLLLLRPSSMPFLSCAKQVDIMFNFELFARHHLKRVVYFCVLEIWAINVFFFFFEDISFFLFLHINANLGGGSKINSYEQNISQVACVFVYDSSA